MYGPKRSNPRAKLPRFEAGVHEAGSGLVLLLLAGAIAQALAAPDPDIEAAKVAYEEQRFEPAAALLAQAEERRGERPEIAFNQGLLAMAQDDDGSAKKLFERASESPEAELRASARFELGNLAFDESDWDSAIANYIECLKERPLHEDAKWNLELALTKKQEEEKEKEKQKNKDGEENNEQEKNEDESQDEDKDEQDKSDEEKQDQDDKEQEQKNEEGEDGSSSSGGEGEDESQDGSSSSSGEDESSSDQGEGSTDQEDQSSSESQDPQQKEQEPAQQAPSAPAKSNLDRALEDLDREDPFMFGMPRGRRRRVKEDW